MTARRIVAKLIAVGSLLGCVACSPPEAVKDPTWADVYPILQGQCLGCHGSSAAKDGGSFRFDFLNASATCKQEAEDDLAAGFLPPPSFMAARAQILADIRPYAEGLRPKMPPEPARLLEEWQTKTLENFIVKLNKLPPADAVPMALGPLPKDAQAPRISATYVRAGNELTVNYVVADDNADPVIGKLRIGGRLSHAITSTGNGQAVFNLAGVPAPFTLDARLCDGWAIRTRGAADGLPTVQ